MKTTNDVPVTDMNQLIVIAGPTACGKTAVAIELAKRIGSEIISADSMQVYKYMDIGTAKPSIEEMQGIRHYLVDELEPDEDYSVAEFTRRAQLYAEEILAKSMIPILAGGTGFYINAFLRGNEFTETTVDAEFREYLYVLAREHGNGYVYEMLRKADPDACEMIHMNNLKRVIRALEFHNQTGERISAHNRAEKQRPARYNTVFVVLCMPREKLYRRIEERVDIMIKRGLADEVGGLLERGYSPELISMQGLGYKELVPYVQGRTSLDESVEMLKRNTRRFAKRQITWFKNQNEGCWIDVDESDNVGIIVDEILSSGKDQFEGSI